MKLHKLFKNSNKVYYNSGVIITTDTESMPIYEMTIYLIS